MHIAYGEVQALRAGRRDDVAGAAGEEEAPEAQGLGDEAAQGGDALLDRRAGDEPVGGLGRQAAAELGPEALVGPLVDLLGERDLQVVTAARVAALAAEREAALVVDVDQLVRHRRRVR